VIAGQRFPRPSASGTLRASQQRGSRAVLRAFVVIVCFQFAGEALSRLAGLPVPGPVVGLALLVIAALAWPALQREVEEVADLLLRHLSLLFVPAGVGVLQYMDLLRREWLPLLAVVVVSTALTLAVSAIAFTAMTKRGGGKGAGA
jgi:holin-like protein